MRHTRPQNGHPMDGARELTDEGKTQALDMAEWLRSLIGRVDIVLCSPMKRSLQTAAIMAGTLGAHYADTKMLEPDQQPEDAWKEIERLAQQSKDVLIIGHDPSLNKLILWLQDFDFTTPEDLGQPKDPVTMLRMDWGAVAYVKIKTDADGRNPYGALQWLVTPALVLRPEAEQELLEAAKELIS